MSIEPQEMRRRLQEARVARLGTVAPDGRPHLVPCVFVFEGETIYTPIDHKRKHLVRRLRNIGAKPGRAGAGGPLFGELGRVLVVAGPGADPAGGR